MRFFSLVLITLIAFAANSVLARLALKSASDDLASSPMSFTLVRLFFGALMLLIIVRPSPKFLSRDWRQASALFAYALFFSIAYVLTDAGTGALILFGAVQITMLTGGFIAGERLSLKQVIGAALALFGLVILLSPTISTPLAGAAFMMIVSGISWGLYSLMGRGSKNPARQTGENFVKAAFLAALLCGPYLWFRPEPFPSNTTIVLAAISGAVTSGLGYVLWYHVLRALSASRAAISQLSVPALAAIGGVLFLAEPITPIFILASVLILGGVALAVINVRPSPPEL